MKPQAQNTPSAEGVRLNKLIAQNGIASRRRADQMIEEGAVLIDGQIVTELGIRVDPEYQRIEVNGVPLRLEGERHQYYLLNKPGGVICTNERREFRPRAIDLITDKRKGRIYTVGRLDEETVGLVILTNDGEFANHVSHPRNEVPKTYRVAVIGRIPDRDLDRLRGGVHLSEFRANFAAMRVTKRTENQTILTVTLKEGRNREIRRAFARLGLKLKSLRRVAIGAITDRGLKVGHWRTLTRQEIEGLMLDGGAPPSRPAPQRGRTGHGARGSHGAHGARDARRPQRSTRR